MRVLQLMQDTPAATLRATDVVRLQRDRADRVPVIDVATAAGVMLDDRQPAIHAYFDTTTAELPEPMRTELPRVVRRHDQRLDHAASAPAPRSADHPAVYLRWAMPALTAWAEHRTHLAA